MAKVQPPKDDDVFPPPDAEEAPPAPVARSASKLPASLQVTGVELVTAPAHVLLVKLVGEANELIELKKAIQRTLPTDVGSVAPLPSELASTLESRL